MTRAIIDACTYGKLILEKDADKLVEKIIKDKSLIIVDFKIVREELRNGPKRALTIYDSIIRGDKIQESKQITHTAQEYDIEYKKGGGGTPSRRMKNDFKIVACASLKSCDIVYSEDSSTMKSKKALKAYEIVNLKRKLRTPKFLAFPNLKARYL